MATTPDPVADLPGHAAPVADALHTGSTATPRTHDTTGPAPAGEGLQRFEVELMAHVYVRVPVLAESDDQATRAAADLALPRWPVVATLAAGCAEAVSQGSERLRNTL